ncbi:MAG TPA: BTAD domain-containing putative transcriptional regulator [Streptosporangiaceae bacterium]|nr:BTAD domain-containing putative transcriptional regulator [Streptosporangiaceae bacterium]
MTTTMRFLILGQLAVIRGDEDIVVRRGKLRALLAMLLLGGGRIIPADRLISGLWGDDPPDTAVKVLQTYVSQLRTLLEPERDPGTWSEQLITEPTGYRLAVDPDAVDAFRFERLVERAAGLIGPDPATARHLLAEALALWRGPALADFTDEAFAETEIARLEELRLTAIEQRVGADLALGRHEPVVAELRELVRRHPLRETLWEHLMLALYRCGRQADALERYEQIRRRLAEELGADPPPALRRLHAAILRQDPALDLPGAADARRPAAGPGNLPAPLTSFIGRGQELAELRNLLTAGRLVTITGVGGAGKSRLALEAARLELPRRSGGTWLVELAALNQPDLVAHVVAATLGVRERPQRPLVDLLIDRLRGADALLILDNCEHLVDAVAGLAHTLLAACPRLRILATSRERLGMTGEVVRPISGLSVPAPGTVNPAALADADAVRLLVERAAAVDPGFRLDAATAAATAHLCRRLDGLPLAIELAAAGVNSLGVEHITAHLDDRFRLLAHGNRTALARHQTLRSAVDWSYDLLTPAERRLFDRLGVFAGGFTLDAAEKVCAEPAETAETAVPVATLLAGLVDKSLVVTDTATRPAPDAGGRRYRLLETLRVYALERLDEAGEAGRLRDRHAAFVLTLAETAETALRTAHQPAWLRRLVAEHDNIRAALAWCAERGDAATAVRLAGTLHPLWDRHGHYTEGRRWLDQALALPGPVPPAARALALDTAAGLAMAQGDLEQAMAACRQAAALCRQAGDLAGLARVLQHLGLAAIYAEDLARAATLLDTSLRHARDAGDEWLQGWSLLFLALTAMAGADYARSAGLAHDCEQLLRPDGDPECVAWALILRAGAAWRQGDLVVAQTLLRAGMRDCGERGYLWALSVGLFLGGMLAGARADDREMTVLLSAAETLRDSIGVVLLPFVKPWLAAAVTQAKTALGPRRFDEAWRTGQTLTLEAAAAMAMAMDEGELTPQLTPHRS